MRSDCAKEANAFELGNLIYIFLRNMYFIKLIILKNIYSNTIGNNQILAQQN